VGSNKVEAQLASCSQPLSDSLFQTASGVRFAPSFEYIWLCFQKSSFLKINTSSTTPTTMAHGRYLRMSACRWYAGKSEAAGVQTGHGWVLAWWQQH
jgi:hypothetical protein